MYLKTRKNTCILLLLCISTTCFALPDDKLQILQLSADNADISQETRTGTYTHDVMLDQGSTHLRAERAITKVNEANKLIEAMAWGTPQTQAHFWTLTDAKKEPLHAYADTIRYFPEKHLIQLVGNASVTQGKDSFSAPEINFDVVQKHVTSAANNQGRTLIIIHPGDHHD